MKFLEFACYLGLLAALITGLIFLNNDMVKNQEEAKRENDRIEKVGE